MGFDVAQSLKGIDSNVFLKVLVLWVKFLKFVVFERRVLKCCR